MGYGGWAIQFRTLQLMRSLVPKGSRVLEFGSGEGTRELSKFFEVTSIEHDSNWIGNCPKSTYIHAPLVRLDSGRTWYDWNKINKHLPKAVDIIFVDGPPGFIGRQPFSDYLDSMPDYSHLVIDDSERDDERELVQDLSNKLKQIPISFAEDGREFTLFLNDKKFDQRPHFFKNLLLGGRFSIRLGPFVSQSDADETLKEICSPRDWNYSILENSKSEFAYARIGTFLTLESTRRVCNELAQEYPIFDIFSSQSLSEVNSYLDAHQEVMKKWVLEENILTLKAEEMDVTFSMPEDWTIENTHPDLFKVAEFVLRHPWDKTILEGWKGTRKPGVRPGLAFSTGIDSTAAMLVMPEDTILAYHRRNFDSKLDHSNADRFIQKLRNDGKELHVIESNHEMIRTHYDRSAGFSSDYAVGVHLILLADYFDLDGLAVGMPLENTYFYGGYKFRKFTDGWFWKLYAPLFKSIGLELIQPISGCSEIVNKAIVEHHGLLEYAQSCLRSNTPGDVCGSCWKCFRKNTLTGTKWKMSNEIDTFLKKTPLKMAVSTLYSIQKMQQRGEDMSWLEDYSHLNGLIELDLDWLEMHYLKSQELIPEKYRQIILDNIHAVSSPLDSDERLANVSKVFLEDLGW